MKHVIMDTAKIVIAQYTASPKYTDDVREERRLRSFISNNINALFDLRNGANEWIKKIKMYPVSTQGIEEKYYRFYIHVLRSDQTKKLTADVINTIEELLLGRLDEGELHNLWSSNNTDRTLRSPKLNA